MEVTGEQHALATLFSCQKRQVSLNKRLGGPYSQFGSIGEEINHLTIPGMEQPFFEPDRSLVAVPPVKAFRRPIISLRRLGFDAV
jgi:hypothetical protein